MNNVVDLHAVSVYDVLAAMSEPKTGKAVGTDGNLAEAFVYGYTSYVPSLLLLTVCI